MLERKFFKKFMEKTNKVLRIVLCCASFAFIAMFLLGLFALPLFSGANIYDFVKNFIESIKNSSGGSVANIINTILAPLVMMGLAVVFGIIGIVKGIKLLIASIKGLSAEEGKAPVKPLLSFGLLLLVFVACLSSVSGFYSLGAGSIMFLLAGILAVCGVGVFAFFARSEEKLLNRIFALGLATLAVVGLLFTIRGLVSVYGYRSGAIGVIMNCLQALIAGAGSKVAGIIFAMFGAILLFVALGFAKAVVVNALAVEEEKKEADNAKSSIVKSALWFGFLLVGFLLVVIPFSADGYDVAASGIVALVLAASALGLAIVSKVLGSKESK